MPSPFGNNKPFVVFQWDHQWGMILSWTRFSRCFAKRMYNRICTDWSHWDNLLFSYIPGLQMLKMTVKEDEKSIKGTPQLRTVCIQEKPPVALTGEALQG